MTALHVLLVMGLAGLSTFGLIATFIHVTAWACRTAKKESQ